MISMMRRGTARARREEPGANRLTTTSRRFHYNIPCTPCSISLVPVETVFVVILLIKKGSNNQRPDNTSSSSKHKPVDKLVICKDLGAGSCPVRGS